MSRFSLNGNDNVSRGGFVERRMCRGRGEVQWGAYHRRRAKIRRVKFGPKKFKEMMEFLGLRNHPDAPLNFYFLCHTLVHIRAIPRP